MILFVSFLLSFLIFFPPDGLCKATASTFYVDDDYDNATFGWGVDHFGKIQDAIGATTDGDTVQVFSGTYYEQITVNKSITLLGEDSFGSEDTTTIYTQEVVDNVVTISADQVNISGFTIKGKWSSTKGIYINSNNNTISINTIKEVRTGIYLRDSSNNILISNTIKDINRVGIRLYDFASKNNIISENIIKNNGDSGVVIYNPSDNIISNNTITNNNGYGLELIKSLNNSVSKNIIKGNSNGGIYISQSSNNNVMENNISNNNEQGIFLWRTSNNIITSNKITNHNIGINISKYSTNDQISNDNIFSNNNINIQVQGEYKSITEKDKFQILPVISYIILLTVLIEIVISLTLRKKIYSILKNKFPEKFVELGQPSVRKAHNVRASRNILLGKLETNKDAELKRYVNLFRGSWIISTVIIIALILIAISVFLIAG